MSTAEMTKDEKLADAEIGKSALRKTAWRLIPLCALLYLLAYLDRVNVGFAALTMNAELGLSATAYGAAAGIFSLGYVLCEVPSNILLTKYGPRRWLARIVITWGLMSAAMALAQGPYSLGVLRFLLGVAEAGLLPGVLYYLSLWFPVAQRTRILSSFFIALPIAFILGAPISTALLSLDYLGLSGWQWMFIIEGLFTAAAGFVVLAFLTEDPNKARWLTPVERDWLTRTLKAEYAARGGDEVAGIRHGLLNANVWLLGAMYFGVLSVSGCFGFWLPLIVKSVGNLSNLEIGFLTAVPYVAAVIGILLWSRREAAARNLTFSICLPILLASAAFIFAAFTSNPITMLVLVFSTVVLIYVVPPLFWQMATKSLNGPAAAAGIALINCIASTGSYFGPQVMGVLRDTFDSFAPGLLVLSLLLLMSTFLCVLVGRIQAAKRPEVM